MMALRKRDFAPAPMIDGRKVMPIEQALCWAYQQELALLGAEGVSPIPSNWSVERVDGSWSGGKWDEAILAQHIAPDALEIHKCVQRLKDDLDWLEIDDLTGLLVSTYVPLSEPAYFEAAFPKAENLVIVHGRLGTVPDLSGRPTPHKVLHPANGSIPIKRSIIRTQATIGGGEVSYADEEEIRIVRAKSRGGVYPQGSFCEVGYYPDWDQVVQERAEYMVWWLALKWLSNNLDHLERMRVTEPQLPMRPWHGLDSALSA